MFLSWLKNQILKYSCFGYGIGFETSGSLSLSDGSGFDKNVLIFSADMSLFGHIDIKKRYLDYW